MIRGLTRAGLGDIGDNETFIANASHYGFQAVDLNPLELIEQYGIDGSRELLHRNEVQIGAFSLDVDWRSTEAAFRKGLPSFIETAAAASELGCTRCCTYILPSTDERALTFLMQATRRIRLCSDILSNYNIRLGLEFVGSHHLRTRWEHPFIWRLDDTLEWIDTIYSGNVGLLLDSYHWHTNGLDVGDILKLRAEQIVHVHVNDSYDLPVEDLLDHERLYPGEGVINLSGFLQSLKTIGYTGVVAQEVLSFNTRGDSSGLLARSQAAFDRLFAPL